ncbi:MAG: hypothetical protein JST00_06195 [Deltaproteobacteria bacterium]|nr:hypothetical protein [Deltaproteobacteria bacterium]
MNQVFLYCLGEAAARFQITLFGWVAMDNHQHLLLRDNLGNFPAFLAHYNKMIAKVLNTHWDRWENFWATEQPSVVYVVEAQDRLDKLIYLLANPVAAQLVERVTDWPGALSLRETLTGEPITVQRPKVFFGEDSSMPATVTLRCEHLPGFEHLTPEEWRKLVGEALAASERRAAEERRKTGTRVRGRKAILAAKHTDTPSTVAPRRELRPHVACKSKERRALELAALSAFRAAYRSAFKHWISKVEGVIFPAGTYRLRLFGVPCDPLDALISQVT